MNERKSRWVRFFEAYMPDGALPVLPGILMAWQPGSGAGFWLRGLLLLFSVYVAVLFVHGSDSIEGYRQGVDELVYKQRGTVKHEKLLVTGEVSLREARVGTLLVLLLLLGLTLYFVLTSSWPVVALGLGTLLFTSQYSVGLRMSYRGLGEAVIAATGLGTPVAYGFVTGHLAWPPVLVGLALGLWHAAANANSNQADYTYDKAASRGTLAVRLGLERHRRFGVGLLVAGWAAFALAIITGGLPAYAALAAVLLYRHVRQARLMYAGQPIAARRSGFGAFRALLWLLCAAILMERLAERLWA